MSTLKTHNLQSPDAGSVNVALAPNAGMVVAGLSTYSNQINVGSNIKIGTAGVVTATSFSGSGANLTSLPAQATIANNADNRVITGGSGVNLNGEANLTFDGSNVIHAGSDGRRYSFAGGGSSHYMKFDSTLNGIILNGYGGIAFETNGTNERLRIDSGGRLGIGANNNDSYDANARNVLIASSANTGITIRSGGSSNYAMIHFADGTTGAAQQRAGRILYEHSTDSLQISTANTFAFKIDSNGHVTQPNLPSFMAYGNASWTDISANTNLIPYVFPNTAHNTGTHYNTTSGVFTAPVTGVYQLNWNIFCASPTNQTTAASIDFYVQKNGTNVSRLHTKKGYGNMGDDQQVVNLPVFEKLNANDEIRLAVYAYNVQWRIYGAHSTFSGALIG